MKYFITILGVAHILSSPSLHAGAAEKATRLKNKTQTQRVRIESEAKRTVSSVKEKKEKAEVTQKVVTEKTQQTTTQIQEAQAQAAKVPALQNAIPAVKPNMAVPKF